MNRHFAKALIFGVTRDVLNVEPLWKRVLRSPLHSLFFTEPTKLDLKPNDPAEKISVGNQQKDTYVFFAGHNANLQCSVEGVPEHLVEWTCEIFEENRDPATQQIDCRDPLGASIFRQVFLRVIYLEEILVIYKYKKHS